MKKLVTLMVFTLVGLTATAQNEPMKTLNVDFKSTVNEGMTLNMSLPMSFLESFHPQIEQILTQVQNEHSGVNFKEIWNSLKDSGPTEFVNIKSEDADIKVSTTTSHLVVHVNEKNEGHNIAVTLPMALGDALFGPGGQIDYEGIVQALESIEGDLVTITGEKMNGRVWIQ